MNGIAKLAVAMMAPRYSANIGYVARVMKNFGLSHLLIVDRQRIGRIAEMYASHASDIVRNSERVGLDDLFEMFDFVIGTTAISNVGRNVVRNALSPEQLAALSFDFQTAVILLGRDTTGLKNDELKRCDVVVSIRTGTSYSSMNISHALAILLYILKQKKFGLKKRSRRKLRDIALGYVTRLAERSDVQEHKRGRVVILFKKMLTESSINDRQVATLIGLLRKLDKKMPNSDACVHSRSKT
jgi:tRNA/rRNA methyltransferase